MPATLTVRDETVAGESTHEFTLDFLTEHITVQELIRSRVYQEVKDYNARKPELFRGLVQPTDAEATLNGFKVKKKKVIDWNEQYELAVQAFEANRVLILVDSRQVESLEEKITIRTDTVVSFLRLVPLVGG